jgi:DNA polymerase eta
MQKLVCVISLRILFPDKCLLETSEKASIDEAFIDLTRPVRAQILGRYRHLATVPHDAPDGLDAELPPPPLISWDGLGTIVPIDPSLPEPAPGTSTKVDHQVAGLKDDAPATWHDVALSIAAEMMGKVRVEISEQLGYTTSAVCHSQ